MIIFATTLYFFVYLFTLIKAKVGVPTGRIHYGTEVISCESYPWHAQLVFSNKNSSSLCGGTLISEKYILTAAHCSDECKVGSDYHIYLGSTKRFAGTKYYGTLKGCLDNSTNLLYDVGLIELTTSVPTSLCIDYIPILDVKDSIEDGLPVTTIGFGSTETIKYPNSLHRSTNLMTMTQKLCEEQEKMTHEPRTAPMCTLSHPVNGQTICGGDSGGSLFFKEDEYKPVLLGISSSGQNPDCGIGGKATYAKVNDPVIFHWIQNMTGNGINFIRIGTRY